MLSSLSFGVPGALAQMRETYNLITEKIDLHGTLKTQAEVSKTTHEIKSLMLKVLDPFFKNKPDGYLAPFKITGCVSPKRRTTRKVNDLVKSSIRTVPIRFLP